MLASRPARTQALAHAETRDAQSLKLQHLAAKVDAHRSNRYHLPKLKNSVGAKGPGSHLLRCPDEGPIHVGLHCSTPSVQTSGARMCPDASRKQHPSREKTAPNIRVCIPPSTTPHLPHRMPSQAHSYASNLLRPLPQAIVVPCSTTFVSRSK